MPSSRTLPNPLAGPYLRRVTHLRKDESRLRAAFNDPQTLFVPVWRTHSYIAHVHEAIHAQLVPQPGPFGGFDAAHAILLGEFHQRLCFAVEVPATQTPELPTATEFCDLRRIAGQLPEDEAGLLAYARALIVWRERHRYCGRCGTPTLAIQGGHVLQCGDAGCGIQQFPRLDPAVIVLVTDGKRALLGRQASWPPARYSTIAGFVEPGESLEDAVAREVLEETGVVVGRVDYHSSQPWPFPSSLMLGFTAQAIRTEIQRQDDELEDARWVTRAQIAAGEVTLPLTHSISFRLIEDWYDLGSPISLRDEPGARLWNTSSR